MALAHPDDEVGVAGTILAHRARGHRVVVLWLTRGERTRAFGDVAPAEVAERRTELGAEAVRRLGVEGRFLDFPDTALHATPGAAAEVAREVARIRPDAVVTWGEAWVRGSRHPDHRACGEIVRDAVTLARIAGVVEPVEPHRAFVPVFTLRGVHSTLPAAGIDVEPHLDGIFELAGFYREAIGFGDREWLEGRLRAAGDELGLEYAEVFDAWETEGGVVDDLVSPRPLGRRSHPDRDGLPGEG